MSNRRETIIAEAKARYAADPHLREHRTEDRVVQFDLNNAGLAGPLSRTIGDHAGKPHPSHAEPRIPRPKREPTLRNDPQARQTTIDETRREWGSDSSAQRSSSERPASTERSVTTVSRS